ncbi:hypothetical protein GC163_03265 [bacterium]|nr:hypothetical protein [bacterium]
MHKSPADSQADENCTMPARWQALPLSIVKMLVFMLTPMFLFRITQMLIFNLFFFSIFPNPGNEKPFWLRPAAESWMRVVILCITILLPAAVLAFAYQRLANRFQVSGFWARTSFVMLAIASAAIFCNVHLSDLPGESRICLGAAPSLIGWHTLQGTAPLLLGWWLTKRSFPGNAMNGCVS